MAANIGDGYVQGVGADGATQPADFEQQILVAHLVMVIEQIALISKVGGKSGDYQRQE